MRSTNVTILIFALFLILFLLVISILRYKETYRINIYYIWWLIVGNFSIILSIASWCMRGKSRYLEFFRLCYTIEYIIWYISILLFQYFIIDFFDKTIKNSKLYYIATWVITIASSVVWVQSLYTKTIFSITYNSVNITEKWFFLSEIGPIILVFIDIVLLTKYKDEIEKLYFYSYLLFFAIFMVTLLISNFTNSTVAFVGITIVQYGFFLTTTQEEAKLLAESKIAIAISQIQPHFLYNSLASISVLCTKDPNQAGAAIDNFAQYLRMNLDSMKIKMPIPFETELKHIQKYLWFEKMRFNEKLSIEYGIEFENFKLPALTVQPIVENSVKHGVFYLDKKGIIKISSYKKGNCAVVEVKDNGVGFDPANTNLDSTVHIGLENVRERLRVMVGGKIIVNSKKNKGTLVKIIIPLKRS